MLVTASVTSFSGLGLEHRHVPSFLLLKWGDRQLSSSLLCNGFQVVVALDPVFWCGMSPQQKFRDKLPSPESAEAPETARGMTV